LIRLGKRVGQPATIRRRYQFVVVGYVVMPEHFHLLISAPEKATPSEVIQALKLGIVRRLFPTSPKNREKWGTPRWFNDLPRKHFWQRRFDDFNVWSVLKMKVRAIRSVAVR
jgi:putative transposase